MNIDLQGVATLYKDTLKTVKDFHKFGLVATDDISHGYKKIEKSYYHLLMTGQSILLKIPAWEKFVAAAIGVMDRQATSLRQIIRNAGWLDTWRSIEYLNL